MWNFHWNRPMVEKEKRTSFVGSQTNQGGENLLISRVEFSRAEERLQSLVIDFDR